MTTPLEHIKTYRARIYVGEGSGRRTVEVRVQADGPITAKQILESQHGVGKVAHLPIPR